MYCESLLRRFWTLDLSLCCLCQQHIISYKCSSIMLLRNGQNVNVSLCKCPACTSSGGLCWLWRIPTCWRWYWWKNVSPTSPTGGWDLTRLNTKMGQNTKTYSTKGHTVKWYCILCSLIQHNARYCCLHMNMWECVQYTEGRWQVTGFKMWINKCHNFSKKLD